MKLRLSDLALHKKMAEVHLIGDIVGGDGFDSGDLFCKWGLSYGSAWRVLEGLEKGQTQVDHPQVQWSAEGVDLGEAGFGLHCNPEAMCSNHMLVHTCAGLWRMVCIAFHCFLHYLGCMFITVKDGGMCVL